MNPIDLFFRWCRGQLQGGEITLRLFTAINQDADISPGSFTEAAFAGYAPVPDQAWINRAADNAASRAFTCLLNWVTQEQSAGQIVLGWYAVLTYNGAGYVVGFKHFDLPVDMSQRGASKGLFALIEMYSLTTSP